MKPHDNKTSFTQRGLMDGLALCETLRRNGSFCPILMLTARDTIEDRAAGLDSGADDYLGKPLPPKSIVC